MIPTSKVMYGAPRRFPYQEMTPLRKAIKAKKAIKLAIMLATKNTALAAPCAAASNALASVLFYKMIKRGLEYVGKIQNELMKLTLWGP